MTNQRLRNLTTGRLHTKMEDIYADLEYLTGEPGIMTHMIPRVLKSLTPWLLNRVTDVRFWDGEFDQSHIGETELAPMDPDSRQGFIERYKAMPNPLLAK